MKTVQPIIFTDREKQVCRMILKSAHNKQISQALGISETTVRGYLHNIYRRFDLWGKPDLILFLRRQSKQLLY